MSVTIGNRGVLGSAVQLLMVAAVVGAVLNAKDIQRYLRIRSM